MIALQRTILFDLDGTLTDSGEGIMNCAQLALTHFGLEAPDRQALRKFVGPPLRESFPQFGVPEDRVEEAVAVFRGRYLTVGKFENFPYPGIRELLAQLKAAGLRLYVATSKPESTAVEILTKFALAPYFEKICGAEMDGVRDSKDAVIAYVLSQLPQGEDLLMVGDTVFDVLGAKAHGIPTVGVAWGYGDTREMQEAGAIAIAENIQELGSILLG
jgi:phosphoglycolate phosphatase